MGSSPLIGPPFWRLGGSGVWTVSAVLSGTFSATPGLQTHWGSPRKSPSPIFWLSVCPWGGPRGPGQHLSSASLYLLPDLMPAPADATAREALAAPPRRLRSRKVSCPLTRSNGDLVGEGVWQELGWGSSLGSAFGRWSWGTHSPDCLFPFQSRSLSPSPLGSLAPSTTLERPSFSSQTGHGT